LQEQAAEPALLRKFRGASASALTEMADTIANKAPHRRKTRMEPSGLPMRAFCAAWQLKTDGSRG